MNEVAIDNQRIEWKCGDAFLDVEIHSNSSQHPNCYTLFCPSLNIQDEKLVEIASKNSIDTAKVRAFRYINGRLKSLKQSLDKKVDEYEKQLQDLLKELKPPKPVIEREI